MKKDTTGPMSREIALALLLSMTLSTAAPLARAEEPFALSEQAQVGESAPDNGQGKEEDKDKEQSVGRAMYASRKIKLFKSKSAKSKVLKQVPKNAEVYVVSFSGSWAKVKYKGKTGYVKKGRLKNEVKPSQSPEATATPTPTPDHTPSATPTPDHTPSATPTPDHTPSATPAPDHTPSATPAPDHTPSASPSATPAPSQDPGKGDGSEANPDKDNSGLNILDKSKRRAKNWASEVAVGAGGMPIPLLYQFDFDEVVCEYNGTPRSVKSSGCNVTCLSMVIAYLTGNLNQDPYALFREAVQSGMYHGDGLGHDAMTKMARRYGVAGSWRSMTKDKLVSTLRSGTPVIAHMGPYEFTEGGHYIVLRGVTEEGKILVNDPASAENSARAYPVELFLEEGKTGSPFMVCELTKAEKEKRAKEKRAKAQALKRAARESAKRSEQRARLANRGMEAR